MTFLARNASMHPPHHRPNLAPVALAPSLAEHQVVAPIRSATHLPTQALAYPSAQGTTPYLCHRPHPSLAHLHSIQR